MKMISNKWITGASAMLVFAAGAGWFVYSRAQTKETESPQVAARSAADQALVDAIMDSPEQFDSVTEGSKRPAPQSEPSERFVKSVVAPSNKATRPKSAGVGDSVSPVLRTNMLSAVEKPTQHLPQQEPVAAENLYFPEDYSSMRKDAVRNPDSPENRQGVVALMKARQRRAGVETE